MVKNSYIVTLILESNIDDANNPVFKFFSRDHAMQLVETFMNQGYEVLINIEEVDKDEWWVKVARGNERRLRDNT